MESPLSLRKEIEEAPAGELVFIRWSKIEGFSHAHTPRTKLVAEAETCWSKEILCPRLRSRKTSLSVQEQEGFPGVKKGGGLHPIIRVDMHTQASVVGSILAKRCPCMLGRVQGSVKCQETGKVIGQR